MARFFTDPNLLWTLAVVPLLAGLALWARRRRRDVVARLGPPGVIAGQVERRSGLWRIMLGWTLGLIALVAGAAGPHWGVGPPPPTAPGRDIVVVLDLSRSMLAQDVLPSRLGKAKEALREFADAVQMRGGHRLALVAFAGQAAVISPLTHDYDHFRAKLAALSADPPPAAVRAGAGAVSGTRIGAGLQRAVNLLSAEPQFRGAQGILLVSDGDDPAGDEEWRAGVAAAREAGVPVDVVGIGGPNADSLIPTASGHLTFQGTVVRTRLQEPPLREIAARTDGLYLAARTGPPELDAYFRDHVASAPTREAVAGTLPQPVGRQAWFFGLALAFIVGAMIPLSPRAAARGFSRAETDLQSYAPRTSFHRANSRRAPLPPRTGSSAATRSCSPADRRQPCANSIRRRNGRPIPAVSPLTKAWHFTVLADSAKPRCIFAAASATPPAGGAVRALYNLGCSLLEESQGRMAGPLRGAVAGFEAALATVRPGDPLADDVRHNLELAKRLLAVIPAAGPNQSDEPPDGPSPGEPASPSRGPDDGNPALARDPGGTPANSDDRPLPKGKPGDGSSPQTTDKRPPGKGHLPPLPDEDALSPMTPEDAQAHLEKAAERIAAERRAQLRATTPAATSRFPEW